MRNTITTFLTLLFFFANAQEETPLNIEAIVGSYEDKVIIRWAPSNERSWLNWSNALVSIYRRELDESGNDLLLPLELVADSLKPWSEAQYQEYADNTTNEDSFVMLVGYLMHAQYETTSEELSMQNMVDRKEELSNRYSSALYAADMNQHAAGALGWRIEDNNSSQSAYYTVNVIWSNGERSTKTIKYSPSRNTIPNPILNRGKEEEKHVILSWDQKFHKSHFTAYWIERSKDGRNYQRLNDVPFVHAFDKSLSSEDDDYIYIDSIENYVPHYYRIIGLSPFGFSSKASDPIKLQAKDKTPPSAPESIAAIMKDDDVMTITWQMPLPSEDLSGYIVKKDFVYDGSFDFLSPKLSNNTLTYVDPNPNYLSQNYYMVCAVDTAGNEGCALPVYGFINDTIPPSKPLGLAGEIDSNGLVTLTWNHNSEIDMKGYHIYFSNRKDGVYSKLTSEAVRYNLYQDSISINTLSEDIYYAITAEDVRSNVSNFSDKIQIEKPDTIPPGPGVFKSYSSNEKGILIKWACSNSRDAVNQQIWRSTEESNELVLSSDLNISSYLDTSIQSGTYYTYSLITFDDDGLSSKSPGDLTILASNLITKPIVEFNYDKDLKLLSYSLSSQDLIDKVVIYQSLKEGPFMTHKISTKQTDNIIKNPRKDSSFKVIAITKKGIKSDPITYAF
jgi:hypothetical protein